MGEWIAAVYEGEPTVTAHCRSCKWSTLTEPYDNAASHTMWSGHKTFVAKIQATYFEPEKMTVKEKP
jgi:hypothetical protein